MEHALPPKTQSPALERALAALPDDLLHLRTELQGMVRLAACLSSAKEPAAVGATVLYATPDCPIGVASCMGHEWSPLDGLTGWLQLNLAEIPAYVQTARPLPRTGMLWLGLDLSASWQAPVDFDPRDADRIAWRRRNAGVQPMATLWSPRPTLPQGDWIRDLLWHDDALVDLYDKWLSDHLRPTSNVQVGGYLSSIQSYDDRDKQDLVLAIDQQEWGDNGGVFVYLNDEGFHATVETH